MPLAEPPVAAPRATCPDCGTELGPAQLACPGCHRLVYAEQLKALAGEAERHAAAGERAAAMAAWRGVLDLLPAGSRQREQVEARIAALGPVDDTGAAAGPTGGKNGKRLAGLGVIGLALWKLKVVVLFVLAKGKLLLLGLTKASTLLSMLLSLGVYWSLWGWKFALGLVLSMYVHEMGHVAALRRYGIAATAPMFIPGLGALVRLKQYPVNAREDATVGLAGPLWGLAAAMAAFAVYLGTGWPLAAAIASTGAWINLFNLMPLGSLDGGRGFRALDRRQRWYAVAMIAAALFLSGFGLLVLLLILAVVRALAKDAPAEPYWPALIGYAVPLLLLTWLAVFRAAGSVPP